MTYPRPGESLAPRVLEDWRQRLMQAGEPDKPVLQPLYIDLSDNPDAGSEPIHLGVRTGRRWLKTYLALLEEIGVNHVALNLRFNQRSIEEALKSLAKDILPAFS